MPTAVEIKKALREAGLEIYMTRGDVVFLADRVRENLLMDAGTYVRASQVTPVRDGGSAPKPPVGGEGPPSGTILVGFVVRAQRNDFPNESEEHLFERARHLAAPAVAAGYGEIIAEVRKVLDPGDGQRTLDTWCEVSFEKQVPNLEAAVVEARFALAIEKAASPTRGG